MLTQGFFNTMFDLHITKSGALTKYVIHKKIVTVTCSLTYLRSMLSEIWEHKQMKDNQNEMRTDMNWILPQNSMTLRLCYAVKLYPRCKVFLWNI